MTRTVHRADGTLRVGSARRHGSTHRAAAGRAAALLLLPMLLLAGCSGGADDAAEDAAGNGATSAASQASDSGASDSGASDGGASDDGGYDGASGPDDPASDGPSADDGATGGDPADDVDQEPYAVTAAPDGFAGPDDPCTGEGAYYVRVGETAEPALPERDGSELIIGASSIDGAEARLTAAIDDEAPRDVEAATIGETVTIEGWTVSVTSICADTEQVEFDLVD